MTSVELLLPGFLVDTILELRQLKLVSIKLEKFRASNMLSMHVYGGSMSYHSALSQ